MDAARAEVHVICSEAQFAIFDAAGNWHDRHMRKTIRGKVALKPPPRNRMRLNGQDFYRGAMSGRNRKGEKADIGANIDEGAPPRKAFAQETPLHAIISPIDQGLPLARVIVEVQSGPCP